MWEVARARSSPGPNDNRPRQTQASQPPERPVSPLHRRRLERKREKLQARLRRLEEQPGGGVAIGGESVEDFDLQACPSIPTECPRDPGSRATPARRRQLTLLPPPPTDPPPKMLSIEDVQAGGAEREQARQERRERMLNRVASRAEGLSQIVPMNRKGGRRRSKSRNRSTRGAERPAQKAIEAAEETSPEAQTQALVVHKRALRSARSSQTPSGTPNAPTSTHSEDVAPDEDPVYLHPIADAQQEWGRVYIGCHRCRSAAFSLPTVAPQHLIGRNPPQPPS